jgi:hypothetical protein
MLSLISTLGGLLISGLPKLLEHFQNKADQRHELALASLQNERELALAAQGFAAQARVEEIRTEQVAMQTQAQMAEAEAEMVKVRKTMTRPSFRMAPGGSSITLAQSGQR